ncbi:MAG: cytochrome c [Pseudomonadota bacterium]
MQRLAIACLAGAAVAVATFSLSMADGHSPIEQRQAAMKTVGKSTKTLGDMVKGASPFDAAAASAALVDMQTAVATYGELFPEGSETGFETEAKDTIWSDRTGFDAVLATFKSEIDGAIAAAPADQAALAAEFGDIGKTCGTCHQTYRVKK